MWNFFQIPGKWDQKEKQWDLSSSLNVMTRCWYFVVDFIYPLGEIKLQLQEIITCQLLHYLQLYA